MNDRIYEEMTCPICYFKKFRTKFFLKMHIKKYHNMTFEESMEVFKNRRCSINKLASYVVNGLS